MLYAFELSGEHEDLPRAEVLACLDLVELEYRESEYFEHCLVVDIEGEPQEVLHKLREVAKRIAMTHHIVKVIDVCPTEIEDIVELEKDAISLNTSMKVRNMLCGQNGSDTIRPSNVLISKDV